MLLEKEYTELELGEVADMVLSKSEGTRLFLLHGEPGSGKTSLVAALCKRLGVQSEVNSPTFSLVNEYPLGGSTVYHLDLYRINKPEELMESGLSEHIDGSAYCFVEWPEIIGQIPIAKAIRIELEYRGSKRHLKMSRLQQD